MLPSWKHALLISYCALQTETVVAPISNPNQHERSFSKTTTAKLTCSSHFAFSSTTDLNTTKRKGVHEEPAALGPQGIPEGQSPPGIPAHRAPFLPALPTGTHLCNTSAAISPDSHGDVQGISEKRHLKGIKWRLRNKKQQAINKFPKVWETLSCALPAHFKVSCAPWRSLSHRQAAGAAGMEQHRQLPSLLLTARTQKPFLPSKESSGPVTAAKTLHLSPCLRAQPSQFSQQIPQKPFYPFIFIFKLHFYLHFL